MPTELPLPYSGLRVLDISQGIAGPYCAHILWQQGAEVTKIEPPAGDWIRFVGVRHHEHSALAIQYNAGKRALALDARTESGKKILFELAQQVDVIVQNFRPGAAERMGIGYDTLSKINPKLVYVSISGYGPDGPYADAPATDSVMQADSGLMFTNQDEHGTPRRLGFLAADVLTGLYASQGAATALYQRLARNRGTHVQVSLFEACAAFQGACFIEQSIAGTRPVGAVSAPNAVFSTINGSISIVVLSDEQFIRLCKVLNRSEWLSDARFATNAGRLSHRELLHAQMAEQVCQQTTEHWDALLKANDILHAPVRNYDDVLNHPQTLYLNMVQQLEQAGVGTLPYIGLPIHPFRRDVLSAPRIGEHSIEILAQAGLQAQQIDALIASGVVLQANALG